MLRTGEMKKEEGGEIIDKECRLKYFGGKDEGGKSLEWRDRPAEIFLFFFFNLVFWGPNKLKINN